MNKSQLTQRVVEIIQNIWGNLSSKKNCYDRVTVKTNSSLLYDLGLDSLDRVELAQEIEKEFEIGRIKDEDVEKWNRIPDIVNTLSRLVA